MNLVDNILTRLEQAGPRVVIQEARDGRLVPTRGAELLSMVTSVRAELGKRGLTPGDRCALIGPNGARWTAIDLAIMAEGLIAVPLYHRQTAAELLHALQDCRCALICVQDPDQGRALQAAWPDGAAVCTFEELFASGVTHDPSTTTAPLTADDPLTLIYTSGTSGLSKGVVLTLGNVQHMLVCTLARLEELLGAVPVPQRLFHYLPCCFAGSWILLLSR